MQANGGSRRKNTKTHIKRHGRQPHAPTQAELTVHAYRTDVHTPARPPGHPPAPPPTTTTISSNPTSSHPDPAHTHAPQARRPLSPRVPAPWWPLPSAQLKLRTALPLSGLRRRACAPACPRESRSHPRGGSASIERVAQQLGAGVPAKSLMSLKAGMRHVLRCRPSTKICRPSPNATTVPRYLSRQSDLLCTLEESSRTWPPAERACQITERPRARS